MAEYINKEKLIEAIHKAAPFHDGNGDIQYGLHIAENIIKEQLAYGKVPMKKKIKQIRAYLRKSYETCSKCKVKRECARHPVCTSCPYFNGACTKKCQHIIMGEPCKHFERLELQKGGVINEKAFN